MLKNIEGLDSNYFAEQYLNNKIVSKIVCKQQNFIYLIVYKINIK